MLPWKIRETIHERLFSFNINISHKFQFAKVTATKVYLLSTKHDTFPSPVNTVTKKTHSNQECSLLVYDCETIFEGVPRLLLYLICFLRFMISQPQRGADRGSYIIGKSVHSQRVERLKHNVFYAITGLYYQNVEYLEEIMKR